MIFRRSSLVDLVILKGKVALESNQLTAIKSWLNVKLLFSTSLEHRNVNVVFTKYSTFDVH